MSVPCVFCDLIRDDSATWVAIEEHAVAFKPLAEDALAPGHTLVIPRIHREGLFGPTEVELAAVMDLVRLVAGAMRAELGSTGTFLLQACGAPTLVAQSRTFTSTSCRAGPMTRQTTGR